MACPSPRQVEPPRRQPSEQLGERALDQTDEVGGEIDDRHDDDVDEDGDQHDAHLSGTRSALASRVVEEIGRGTAKAP